MRRSISDLKYGLAAFALLAALPARADDLRPLCPDRPGKGTSACTLDDGHFQLELGLYDGSFQRRSGITTDTITAGAALVKYGVSDTVDIEAGLTLYQGATQTGSPDQSGLGDLYLRSKWNISGSGALSAVIEPFLKVPTASGGTGNGRLEGGLVVPLSYDLGAGWSLGSTPEIDAALNGAGSGYHATAIDVIGIGRGFDNGLSLGAEVWTSQDFDPAGTTSQYSFDLSAAWVVGADTQLDGGVNLGLNKVTPDAEVYFGISRRF
jgi:hypothetical protein